MYLRNVAKIGQCVGLRARCRGIKKDPSWLVSGRSSKVNSVDAAMHEGVEWTGVLYQL
jgi:hypothetical protein